MPRIIETTVYEINCSVQSHYAATGRPTTAENGHGKAKPGKDSEKETKLDPSDANYSVSGRTPALGENDNGWMCFMHSGPLDAANLTPAQVNIHDIVHGLGALNRFNGQTRTPLSVLWHSLMVAALCRRESKDVQLEALFHDAGETYIGDWIRPLEHMASWQLEELRHRVQQTCFAAAGLPPTQRLSASMSGLAASTRLVPEVHRANDVMDRYELQSEWGYGRTVTWCKPASDAELAEVGEALTIVGAPPVTSREQREAGLRFLRETTRLARQEAPIRKALRERQERSRTVEIGTVETDYDWKGRIVGRSPWGGVQIQEEIDELRQTAKLAWRETLRKDPCGLCGGPGGSIDHIVPRAAGGPNVWSNTSGCCKHCNSGKGANGLLQHLAQTPPSAGVTNTGTAWLDGLRLTTANLRGGPERVHAKHGPVERVLDKLLEMHPEAEGALVYLRGSKKRKTVLHTLRLRPAAGNAGAICRRRKGWGNRTQGEFHRWCRLGRTGQPGPNAEQDVIQAVVLDEEPDHSDPHLWVAVGATATELQQRSYSGTAAEAVEAVRRALPGRRVTLCPRTRRGRELAIQAAGITEGTKVSGYQVWVSEEEEAKPAWHIHWHTKEEARRCVTRCASAGSAVARVRKRYPNDAIRIVTRTPSGETEAAGLAGTEKVLIRSAWPRHPAVACLLRSCARIAVRRFQTLSDRAQPRPKKAQG